MGLIGPNIRYLRREKNLSQEELAKKLGLNRGNIASYEKGLAEPKIDYLIKLAEFFKVRLIQLVNQDLTEGADSAPSEHLLRLKKTARRYETILLGFKEYHKIRMERREEGLSAEKLLVDYEELIEVYEKFLQHHNLVIDQLDIRK